MDTTTSYVAGAMSKNMEQICEDFSMQLELCLVITAPMINLEYSVGHKTSSIERNKVKGLEILKKKGRNKKRKKKRNLLL